MTKRIGVMGCGLVASYGHLPAIAQTPGLELVALYDPNPDPLNAVGVTYPQARRFTQSESFFNNELDAVVVCSPAPAHHQNVLDAARNNVHVLCEKPIAMTDDQASDMIQAMERAGKSLFTAFCYRFSPVAQRIKNLVADKAVGEIRALRLIYVWSLHGKYEFNERGARIVSPRRAGRMIEGGPLVDCGVHQIDLARWWLDSTVVRQHGHGAWVDDEDWEAPDHTWLHLDHASGAHTAVEMSFSYTHTTAEPISQFSYHLIGTDGLIRYDRDGWHFEVRGPERTYYPGGADEKSFAGMYAQWAHFLATGEPGDLPSAEDGLIATRIARTATDQMIQERLSPA